MTAYIVFTKEEEFDAGELATYQSLTPKAREGHDVSALAKYGAFTMLEGDPIEGAVILRFPGMAEAKAWYDSPAYQEAAAHRWKGARYRAFIIDGLD
ncbi:DUF1330 domain-containing protein [Novosphingobium sp. CECT 9465]|uniref:DUF1330 domain-containing protein n=1 Tax=Novosphingobium sp. CECT 9465 TaxID=2829794 RepID=UPI001E461764|nr:DUF1330 domain-containing protein [Novosphingobium sp. CECT 9465]CAH0495261.1 hypothetical protein NVSP9465_00267 [Novosphingobium sp. CECT 9465]